MNGKILIIGSCVSRDAFQTKDFEITYFARSSLISYVSSQRVDDKYLPKPLNSSFQNRIVLADFQKTILEILDSEKFDLILLDFIDERFNVWEFNDGTKVTISNELNTSGYQFKEGSTLISGTLEWETKWKMSFKRFIRLLDKLKLKDKVLINNTLWSDNSNVNITLNSMYDYASKSLKECQFIFERNRHFVSDVNHKWGYAPYHYIRETYNEILLSVKSKLDSSKEYNSQRVSYESIEDFELTFNGKSSIHTITEGDVQIHVKVVDNRIVKEKFGLSPLFFTSAITKRSKISPPYFNGMKYANNSNTLCVMIADPAMQKSDDLATGWYNQLKGFDTVSSISRVIDKIGGFFNVNFLAVGGSAGGFAALNFTQKCKSITKCFVFGPQTNLLEYHARSVSKYLKSAFDCEIDIDNCDNNFLIRKWGAIDIALPFDKPQAELIFAVNKSDIVHLKKHAIPYISKSFIKIDDSVRKLKTDKLLYICAEWGVGHTPPPKWVVYDSIDAILKSCSIFSTEDIFDSATDCYLQLAENREEISFDCIIVKRNGRVFCDVFVTNSDDYEFAFYVVVDGIAKIKKMYSKSSVFEILDHTQYSCNKNAIVRCFVRISNGVQVKDCSITNFLKSSGKLHEG